MIAFVLYGHQATIRPAVVPCSDRSPWTGQRAISYRTSQIYGRSFIPRTFRSEPEAQRTFSTPKAMFSGGGGILGVGPSEVVVILAVGWVLLGPQKLFSLAKDSGKLLGELRRTANEAKDSFNEAMDLDMIAAEFEESKKAAEEGTIPDSDSEDKLKDETEKLSNGSDEATNDDVQSELVEADIEPAVNSANVQSELVEADIEPAVNSANVQSELVEADIEPAVNSAFLEQLQRVADPDQKPPEEVPDLDYYTDEELEVQRLEKQYFEARERLETRRRQGAENGTSESEPVMEER